MSRRRRSRLEQYLEESRDIGRSLALVIPLLLAYEVAVLVLDPGVRNGAEQAVAELLGHLDPQALRWLREGLLIALAVATILWMRRDRARVARPRWVLAESLLLAVALGPVVGLLVGTVGLSAETGGGYQPFLMSIGAGLWEEIVFRLGLLGGLAVLIVRLPGMTRQGALAVAVIVSALVFALYHHLGPAGEPFAPDRFAFRAFAGTILGVLFVLRGLAVVVYMHVFYDLLCDLRLLLA